MRAWYHNLQVSFYNERLNTMTICPSHRAKLGIVSSRSCSTRGRVPGHGKKKGSGKVSSDFSYTLTYLTLKYERNRIFHPCRVLFDFYRQALLSSVNHQTTLLKKNNNNNSAPASGSLLAKITRKWFSEASKHTKIIEGKWHRFFAREVLFKLTINCCPILFCSKGLAVNI